MSASTRWLVIVAGVGALLVAVSVVVALAVDREEEFAAGTPEAAVQAYLRAAAEGDATAVVEMFSADLQARCDTRQIRDTLRWNPNDFRATLRDVTERGDTTEVRLGITQIYGSGPFGRNESTFEQVFVLAEGTDGWVFVEPPWPTWCPLAEPTSPRSSPPRSSPWSSPRSSSSFPRSGGADRWI